MITHMFVSIERLLCLPTVSTVLLAKVSRIVLTTSRFPSVEIEFRGSFGDRTIPRVFQLKKLRFDTAHIFTRYK